MKRSSEPIANATLGGVPGTRVRLWTVEVCPLCGGRHYHSAGGWQDDPKERLDSVKAPCSPDRTYVLIEASKPRKQARRAKRRQERRQGKRDLWDDE